MGLASALSTALTGLNAAESSIDVSGNNLANASTIGFKASAPIFATQFSQTLSLGSGPQGDSGGTNPTQTGLGVQVAAITPDFSQGTIQTSASPSDLAIQGDGFFILQGDTGNTLYTRDGQFTTNSNNQLVSPTGQLLLGYGVNNNFQVNTTALTPLSIPLGTTSVAQATQNVDFEGSLPPTGDVANQAQIIQSGPLGDDSFTAPPTGATATTAIAPPATATGTVDTTTAGGLQAGTYDYKVVYTDAEGNETDSASFSVNVPTGDSNVSIDLSSIPTDSTGNYVGVNIYRTQNQSGSSPSPTYYLDKSLTNTQAQAGFTDTTSDTTLATNTPLNTATLSGNYSYYVTYVKAGLPESQPSPLIGPQNVVDDRVDLSNLPTPSGQYAGGQVRIYRNTVANPTEFFAVATVNAGSSYVDSRPDAAISNPATAGYEALDFTGPKITPNTLLVNVQQYSNGTYVNPFQLGTLSYTGEKGGSELTTQNLTVTNTTTVQDMINFIAQASGIQPSTADPANPVPGDISGTAQGGSVLANGVIQIVSNNGVDNAVTIPLSSLKMTPASGTGNTTEPNLGFTTAQTAVGQSATTNFVVYDSLGVPINVNVTVDLESTSSSSTVYRWFANSPNNQPVSGNSTAVGTGTLTFDGNGNLVSVDNDTVAIQRSGLASSSLQFKLNFNQVSGLDTSTPTLSVSNQDGSAPGTLSSYTINGDGTINGVFSNGVTRTLGEIQLARFTNDDGLEAVGNNDYAAGVNSGLPIQGNPGTQGIGTVTSGALEESNTDVGQSLINLILASTQYRANSRIVTVTDQLYDNLLSLGR
jgi:flagellar hook protein FlgE